MKKEYITPTAEKIRFNYRDQVVAASGDLNGTTTGGNNYPGLGDIIGWIVEGLGYNQCSEWGDYFG